MTNFKLFQTERVCRPQFQIKKKKNQGLFEKGLTLYHKITTLTNMYKKSLESIMEKGETAGNQHFLLFPKYFLLF